MKCSTENGKNEKRINKCVIEFNLASINGLGGSILPKKVKIVVPYSPFMCCPYISLDEVMTQYGTFPSPRFLVFTSHLSAIVGWL